MTNTATLPAEWACPARQARTPAGYLAWAAALAAAYFVTGKLGLMLPTVGRDVTLLWPPTGIAVFALCCWGRRYWPGVAAGAFAVNLTLSPVWVSIGITAGNTLAVLAAASALRRTGFRGPYTGRWDVVKLAVFGAAGPMLVSAVNGPLWLVLNGGLDWPGYLRAVFIWWAGDMAGVLVVAPALYKFRAELNRWRRDGLPLGAAVWLLAIGGVTVAAFTPISPVGAVSRPIGLVPLLLLAWACIGFRGWVASVGVVVVCVTAAFGTAAGGGPFVGSPPDVQLFQLWAFFLITSLVTATVTAVLSERDRVEAALATREAEYRAIVEGNPALIARFTHDGVLTFINDTYCRFKGMSRDDLCGRSIYDLIQGPSREGVRKLFDRYFAGGAELAFLGPFVNHAGEERWIDWKGRDHGGEFQVVGLDVTDRRRLEERVVQAQKLESLGAIAGGVAHDFNNLLAGVMSNADLALADPATPPAVRRHLEGTIQSAGRAAELSRQLLAYAGKGKLVIRPLDVAAAVRRALDLGAKGVPHTVTLTRNLPDDLPAVNGDEGQVQQLVLNLVRNATEAVGDQPGAVEVAAGTCDVPDRDLLDPATGDSLPAGRYVWVRVADTGCGIPPDLRPRIFDPFVTTKFLGRGLGLAAAQGIVRAHGGVIRVDSTAGRGSTFTVYLPASAARPTHRDPTTKPPTASTPPPDPRRTVLVADDEETVREVTALMVRRLGWEVIQAVNGADAIRQFTANADRIRFVLMDLTMPEVDGWRATEAIRRQRPNTPVLLCTGHNQDSITNPDPRTTGVLLKPYRVADLEQAVGRLLDPAREHLMAEVG